MKNFKSGLTSGLISVLLATASVPVLATAAFADVCSCPCGASGIRAEEPPPPLPEYQQPPMPAPGYMWTPGYWAYNNSDYYWTPGTWVEPPHPGLLWTPGYWGWSDGSYVFFPGYWGRQVGFYGGVDYGYGYGSDGYRGGRWDNGVFFYNAAVTAGLLAGAHSFNEPVPRAAGGSRASFNGGAGGTTARATPEQLAAAKDPHEKPTAAQRAHVRAASMSAGAFATSNHGKPAVAATARPAGSAEPAAVKAAPAALTAPEAPKPSAAPKPATAPKPAATPANEPVQKPHPAEGEHARPQAVAPATPGARELPHPAAAAPHAPPRPQAHAPQPQVHAAPPAAHPPQAHAAPAAAHPPQVHAAPPAVHPPQAAAHPPGGHPHCGVPGEPPCR